MDDMDIVGVNDAELEVCRYARACACECCARVRACVRVSAVCARARAVCVGVCLCVCGLCVWACLCVCGLCARVCARPDGQQSRLQSPIASRRSFSLAKTETHGHRGQIGNSLFKAPGEVFDQATSVTNRTMKTGWWSSQQAMHLGNAEQLIFWAGCPEAGQVAGQPRYKENCLARAATAAKNAGVELEAVRGADWVGAYYMKRPVALY